MKKNLLLLLAVAMALPAFADIEGNGYYRVKNYGTGRYVEVIDNTGGIDWNATDADLHAIKLMKDFNLVAGDPASLIYMSYLDNNQYNLEAQGTSVYQIIGHNIKLRQDGSANGQNLYRAYATYSGVTKYLIDATGPIGDTGIMGTTGNGSSSEMALWYVQPINADSDNYFGAILPLKANDDKYYGTLYASFPLIPVSSSTKIYTIGRIENGMAEKIEVSGRVPAGTPILVEGPGSSAFDNKMNVGGNANAVSGNNLKGTYFDFASGSNNYVAFDPNTMRVLGLCEDGSIGFVITDLTRIPANTCWISVPSGSPSEIKIVTTTEFDNYTPPTPPAPEYPEALYVVGSFNGWTVPSQSGSNYITLAKTGEATYSGTISYDKKGELSFKVFDEITSDWTHAYGATQENQETLAAGQQTVWDMMLGDGAYNFTVSNWGGATGTITVDLEANTLSLQTQTIQSFPDVLWLVGNFNSWNASDKTYLFTNKGQGVFTATFTLPEVEEGDNFAFKIAGATDWSINYGAPGDAQNYTFELYNDFNFTSSVIEDGKNWSISNWEGGKLVITLDLKAMTLTLEGPSQPNAPIFGEQVWMIGDMNGWNFDNSIYVLTTYSSNTYQGTFDLPIGTYYFRFYTELGDPDSHSIGSSVDPDYNATVKFNSSDTYTSPYVYGKGCWVIEHWDSTPFTVTLNTQAHLMTIYAAGADVERLETESNSLKYAAGEIRSTFPTEIQVFNTAGQAVAKTYGETLDITSLPKGIYFVVAGAETLKIVK